MEACAFRPRRLKKVVTQKPSAPVMKRSKARLSETSQAGTQNHVPARPNPSQHTPLIPKHQGSPEKSAVDTPNHARRQPEWEGCAWDKPPPPLRGPPPPVGEDLSVFNLPPSGGSTRAAGEGGQSRAAAFPAKAGIQCVNYRSRETVWVPAFAGKADGAGASSSPTRSIHPPNKVCRGDGHHQLFTNSLGNDPTISISGGGRCAVVG
jgi:hypothetical protein